MRQVRYSVAASLDGYIADTSGGFDWILQVAGLRAEAGEGDIWLFGGGQLFASLLSAGQVDTVEVTIVPVLLGGGIPLLAPGIARAELRLTHTHRYPSGMVSLVYAAESPA
jgi:dihydrofolate reductase